MPKPSLKSMSILVGIIAMISLVPLTLAAEDESKPRPDASRGQDLAERLCVNCHTISSNHSTATQADVPSFKSIANKPHQTAEHIRYILLKPHSPMPEIQLTLIELDDLIAYFDSVRDPSSGPRLVPKTKEVAPKPKYPEPS